MPIHRVARRDDSRRPAASRSAGARGERVRDLRARAQRFAGAQTRASPSRARTPRQRRSPRHEAYHRRRRPAVTRECRRASRQRCRLTPRTPAPQPRAASWRESSAARVNTIDRRAIRAGRSRRIRRRDRRRPASGLHMSVFSSAPRPATSSRCRSTASCRRRTRTARTTTRAPACSPSAAPRRLACDAPLRRSPLAEPAARSGAPSAARQAASRAASASRGGAYEKGKEPSAKGLPEAKDFGKKKRKADEEAPEDIKAVPADEMAALVFKMKTYAGAALCVPRRPA